MNDNLKQLDRARNALAEFTEDLARAEDVRDHAILTVAVLEDKIRFWQQWIKNRESELGEDKK